MKIESAQKIAYVVNTVMLSTIFGFLIFFIKMDIPFLVYFSIPTAVVYAMMYLMVYKKKLNLYLWIVYGGLILYTSVTAVCLGESYGFHLYCFSMIPCIYTTEYMSFKLGIKSSRSFYISIGIAVFYLLFMGYVSRNGPVYDVGKKYASFFLMFNSITVFCYLVFYTNYLIQSIIKSETKLLDIAHKDRLTGLYNRHYMLDKLSELPAENTSELLAIADIDDFKKINDTYGHNAGDEVLRVISRKMRESCTDCEIARWGGEEFLILCSDNKQDSLKLLEQMHTEIGSEPVIFEGNHISVTLTVGVSHREHGSSIDAWIHQIDKKLYIGKKNGKNQIVYQ
jgi:diguanylate cyclase (GGDEF)-like protein